VTTPIEFDDEPTALYRLYDEDGVLLYVGITRNPPARMKAHAAEKSESWWAEVATTEIEWLSSRPEALTAESIAIRDECPEYNISGAIQQAGRRARLYPMRRGGMRLQGPHRAIIRMGGTAVVYPVCCNSGPDAQHVGRARYV